MNKVENNFNENVYSFTTDSGLQVYLVHRPGFKRSSAVYGTPFGALNLKQIVDGKAIEHKSGVAHFLEHKLFEDETKDVLSQFADMGANANAFTSYDQTMYYFGHNGSIEEPLRLLIQFVSKFSVTAESVEKEKGIIVEELKMYEQMPDMRLLMETYRNIFHTYPFIYDIAGTEESVRSTTLEDLRQAYELNYSDQRMCLVVVSPEDPKILETIIREECQSHPLKDLTIENVFEDEPNTVANAYREIEDIVEQPKMSLAYKFPYSGADRLKEEFLIRMILEMNFSEMCDDYQSWLDKGIISNGYGYDIDLRDGMGVLFFMNEGDQPEEFELLIDDIMNNLVLDEVMFNQLLKRYYGEMIMALAKFDDLAITIARAHFDGVNYFDYLEMVKNLEFEELEACLEYFKQKDKTFLLMKNAVE